jgi:two-component system LytT family sensor kinase
MNISKKFLNTVDLREIGGERSYALRHWGVLFLVWTCLGLFMFSADAMQMVFSKNPIPWWQWQHLVIWIVGVYSCFSMTPLILWLGRRLSLERKFWIRRTVEHLGLAVVLGLFQFTIESEILAVIGVFPNITASFAANLSFLLVFDFHRAILRYWMILEIQYGIGWYRNLEEQKREALRLELRASQLEKQLSQAHLSALKMQIQPHFLFNTLNAIMVLVRQQESAEAEEMLSRLSDLLPCVLEDVNSQEIPLQRELEYIQLYLSIEQVRFRDRLLVEIKPDPEVLDAAVPHMVLQPLVENAIRHGIGRSSSAGVIRISAYRANDMLEIVVQDDGPGLSVAPSGKNRGIGIANTRARLNQLYGGVASLSLMNGKSGGMAATVILPCCLSPRGAGINLTETHAFQSLAG